MCVPLPPEIQLTARDIPGWSGRKLAEMTGTRTALAITVALAVCAGAASASVDVTQMLTALGNNPELAYLEFHEHDDALKDIDDPSLRPDQLETRIQEKAKEIIEREHMWIPTPNYLMNGLLGLDNAETLDTIARLNDATWKGNGLGWELYNGTVSQEDIDWFLSWDRNTSALYAQSIQGVMDWMDVAVDTWSKNYLLLNHNMTSSQMDIANMNKQFDKVMVQHVDVGTESGGLIDKSKSSGEKFTLAMNIMNFVLNLLNLIGLAAFLIIKRKVGPSAVLDTEMTFPSSPTAQI